MKVTRLSWITVSESGAPVSGSRACISRVTRSSGSVPPAAIRARRRSTRRRTSSRKIPCAGLARMKAGRGSQRGSGSTSHKSMRPSASKYVVIASPITSAGVSISCENTVREMMS